MQCTLKPQKQDNLNDDTLEYKGMSDENNRDTRNSNGNNNSNHSNTTTTNNNNNDTIHSNNNRNMETQRQYPIYHSPKIHNVTTKHIINHDDRKRTNNSGTTHMFDEDITGSSDNDNDEKTPKPKTVNTNKQQTNINNARAANNYYHLSL